MSDFDKVIKIIQTVGAQWPFLIVVSLIVIVAIKWKYIWKGVGQFRKIKIKKGDSELEFSSENEENVAENVDTIQKTKQIENKKYHDINKEIPKTLFDTYWKLREGKTEESRKIFDEVQKVSKEPEKTENYFTFLFYQFVNGIPDIEEEFLRAIHDKSKNNNQKLLGHKYLGLGYKNIEQYEKAINSFHEVINLADEPGIKNEMTIQIADCMMNNEEVEKAISYLLSEIKSTIQEKLKANLYVKLAEIYDKLDDKISKAIALEQALFNNTNDTSILFDIAYCYSETDYNDISIYHYLNLINLKPNDGTALNNIGVGFKNKGLPFQAVNYFKKAVKNNESLAASNLAYLFMETGFSEEAEQLFKEFTAKQNAHKNLIFAQSKLASDLDDEKERKKQIKDAGFKLSKYFRKYAVHYYEMPSAKTINNEKWTDLDKNDISVSIVKNELKISWRKTNTKLEDDDIFVITGQITNQACEILFKVPITKTPGIFSSINPFTNPLEKNKPYREITNYNGYCILDVEHNAIDILYKKDKENIFLSLHKSSA